jgi:hypothetical protein
MIPKAHGRALLEQTNPCPKKNRPRIRESYKISFHGADQYNLGYAMVYQHEYDVDYVAEGKLGNGVCNMLFISMLSDVARLRPQEDIGFSFEGSEDGERWRARVVADTFCAPRGTVTAFSWGSKMEDKAQGAQWRKPDTSSNPPVKLSTMI